MLVTMGLFVGGAIGILAIQYYLLVYLLKINLSALLVANTALLTAFYGRVMRVIWWVCAKIWTPLLRYYKYEPHTLKPIIEEPSPSG